MIPGPAQYRVLLSLASGHAGMSRTTRQTRPLLEHGWVTAEHDGKYWHFVRVTPAGLRALADAVERYGLPGMPP